MTQPDSVWELSLTGFRDALAARAMLGCGAAAVVTADFGLALVVKGLKITRGRTGDQDRQDLIRQAEALMGELGDFADRDARAFEAYLEATQLPHQTQTEQAARHKALNEAAQQINDIPLAGARLCLSALQLAKRSLPRTAPDLQSDTIAGALLIHSGLSSLLLNIDANISSLPGRANRRAEAEERHALQGEADQIMRQLAARNERAGDC